ncbi:MAG: hypothetical protein OEV73_04580 [Desulfobulbaceae bacterium]|nr:hypothetical protein [Desulfobulbaceae bacterium]
MNTDLTYVNYSLDRHCPRVVFAQRNLADPEGRQAVAWKVIRDCGHMWWHPFRFDWRLAVEVGDAYGNRGGRVMAVPGDRFAFGCRRLGQKRLFPEARGEGDGIRVTNRSGRGAFIVRLYRGELVLAQSGPVPPGESVSFAFDQTLLVGTSLRQEEGTPMELAKLLGPAAIDLTGLRQGRIVMTGGGHGPAAQPLRFYLDREERW